MSDGEIAWGGWRGGCGGLRGQHREGLQGAELAHGTALDIDAHHPQEEGADGFHFDRDGRRRLGQEGAALGEVRCASTIGEQAEVDADEAVGDDMEEEAPKKLVGLEFHGLHAVAIGIGARQ